MSKYRHKPLSPNGLKTHSLGSRESKVQKEALATPLPFQSSLADYIESLPDILAARDLRLFIERMRIAREKRKPIIFGMGAHIIKVGLNPIVIDMMKEGWVTAVALNGAGIIHDFEMAFAGKTSEDVSAHLGSGCFGVAEETGSRLNRAIEQAHRDGLGLGEGIGRMIAGSDFEYKEVSLLGSAYNEGIPVTVHAAIGTDIIHFHPGANGEAVGGTSLRDFFLLASIVSELEGGGIYINAGSAVILPEVFLKCISLVRNKGMALEDFTTAVFDFNRHYRPEQNVVLRPTAKKGRGFYFVGHHEIMIPLLAAILKTDPKTSSI